MGGYLTGLILEIRDAAGLRDDFLVPVRPKLLVDGVPPDRHPVFHRCKKTWLINCRGRRGVREYSFRGRGSTVRYGSGSRGQQSTIWLSRKTSLAQRDFGLLDTGEIFLSTNPGTQLEFAGFPWAAGDGFSQPAHPECHGGPGRAIRDHRPGALPEV